MVQLSEFGTCVHLWTQRYSQDHEHIYHPKKFPLFIMPSSLQSAGNHWSAALHYFAFYVKSMIPYRLFCVWLLSLSINIMRFIPVVLCINNLSPPPVFTAVQLTNTNCMYLRYTAWWCEVSLGTETGGRKNWFLYVSYIGERRTFPWRGFTGAIEKENISKSGKLKKINIYFKKKKFKRLKKVRRPRDYSGFR